MGRRLATSASLLLAVVALACAAGCTGPLEGTSWRLTSWSVSSLNAQDFGITATFSGGQVGGSGAVNSYGGPYATGPGAAFTAGPLSSTLIAGPEPAMRAEVVYAELLGGAKSFRIEDDRLRLFDAEGNESLVFERTD